MTEHSSIAIAWLVFTLAVGGSIWLASREHVVERLLNGTITNELRHVIDGR